MKNLKFFAIFLLMLISTQVWGQQLQVQGNVSDKSNGEPLIGVSVLEKGTQNGTVTDFDGNFSLSVSANATIVISYVGYKTQEATASQMMNIKLEEDAELLDELVVTGYTSQRKADLTGAVSVVSVNDLKKQNENNPMKALQGKVPGMTISADGSPAGNATIQAFLAAMPADSLRLFDINLRQSWYTKEVIEQSLQRCNVLKINDEELDVVAPMLLDVATTEGHLIAEDEAKATAVCHQLIERYELKMLILTCGATCSYVFSPSEMSKQLTPKVQVVDTVGAGDSFTAAFVAQTLLGKSMQEAHETAVRVSAYVCTQEGAMPILPKEIIG